MESKVYFCIDLKTFYASVECVARGLDPFKTNLVVADSSRGKGTICLAISPAMKALGIRNRCRVFEIPEGVKYLVAKPRMKKYMEVSAQIYAIYLRYFAKEDIFPYSIDEMFMDASKYLKFYKLDAYSLAKRIVGDILKETGITATAGIGTNLFLTKVALDICAKHNKTGIGYLNEEMFKEQLWHHTPLTDFWQIGPGITRRLHNLGVDDLYGVTKIDEAILYKEFGVNAEILIDHAYGREIVTIEDIKKYRPKSNSLSHSQVLFEDYKWDKARLVVKEMTDTLSLKLVENQLITNHVSLYIGYSKDVIPPTGESEKMSVITNVYSVLVEYILRIFDETTKKDKPIRRIGITFSNIMHEALESYDLFTDEDNIKEERKVEQTMNEIKSKFGKNAIMRGMNYLPGATQKMRNKLIGGHNSGEDD